MKIKPLAHKMLLASILATLCFAYANAQQVQTFPNYNQLPGPVVSKVAQDEEGYMWYATTESGIMRDNGYQIDTFNGEKSDGYSRNDRFVIDICLTNDGRVLYATRTGVWVLDKRTFKVTRFASNTISGVHVSSVIAAHDNTVWAATHSIVYHLSPEGKLLRSFETAAPGEASGDVTLWEDSKHTVWMLKHAGGLKRYEKGTESFESCMWNYDYPPLCIVEDTEHKCFWIGTQGGGVVKYVPAKGTEHEDMLTPYLYDSNGDRSKGSFVISIVKQGNRLLTSTLDNLYVYRIMGEDIVPEDASRFTPARQKVRGGMLTTDRSGNVWVASYSPKPFVIMQQDVRMKKFGVPQIEARYNYPLVADEVENEDDGLWLLQSRKGLVHYDTKLDVLTDRKVLNTDYNIYIDNVIRKRKHGDGIWLFVNEHDICTARLVNGTIIIDPVVSVKGIVSTMDDDEKGHLLVGSSQGIDIVAYRNRRTIKSYHSVGAVSDLSQAKDGRIFFTSNDKGLAYLNSKGKAVTLNSDYDYDKIGIVNDSVVAASSPDGVVVTYNLNTKECKVLPGASDNKGCIIKQMKVDGHGHLWILTSLYVKEYNIKTESCRIFNSTDDMIDIDYFQSIAINGNRVFLSGAGNIFEVPANEKLQMPDSRPSVPIVTNIEMGGRRICVPAGCETINISPDSMQMVVFVSTTDPLNAANVRFAYRLSENNGWIYLPAGMNGIPLSQLSKGKHVLQVMATKDNGTWSEAVDVVTINRLPYWYETWWAHLLFLLMTFGVIALVFRLMLNRMKAKRMEEMEHKLTEMKFRFFTNMSHELRTPLTLIITPLSSIIRELGEGDLRTKLMGIKSSADDLLQLINKLLAFRKLELGQTELQLRYGALSEFVQQAKDAFVPLCEKKGLKLEFTSDGDAMNCYFDKNLIHHIVFNLLSNAQKYTMSGGRITVDVRKDKEGRKAVISVADTGVGISKKDQERIFNRYFQAENAADTSSDGTGIGLSIVSEFANIHMGSVEVDSELGKGTTFRVLIPLDLSRNAAENKASKPVAETVEKPAAEHDTQAAEAGEEKLNVLVVEDNTDLLQYVASELSKLYNVFTASDGVDGWAIAQEKQIDVVMTDVMMPGIDGFELCSRIKKDNNTSHIPVIMLTAMGGQTNELAGFQHGADYYISKPFDVEILFSHLARINMAMQERRKALLTADEHDVGTLYQDEIDRKMMTKVMEILDKNMSDSEYGIEQLSSDMCMSRITLYRKIKALTGQAPLSFIRMCRLKRAEQLLRSTDLPVTEVSEMVGFNSLSHFSHIFRAQYDIIPTEYRKQKRTRGDD